jgi:uncharacterized protein (TIGR02246 family)
MTTLEARLQRLEDRDAIHQLFVDYGRYLDAGDIDAYASLFAEDAEILLGPIGRATGRDNIRELMGKILQGRAGSAFHIISSPAVTLDGDEATSEVMWTVIQRDTEGKPKLTSMGRHVDRLVRKDGVWKIAQRRGLIDLPQQLPQAG